MVVFKKFEEKITCCSSDGYRIVTCQSAGMACFTPSPFVIGVYYFMYFPIHLPKAAIWIDQYIMDHFNNLPYDHFLELHYEILADCLVHLAADVFSGSF